MDIQRSQIRQSAGALVLVLHPHGLVGLGRQCGVYAVASLDAGLLIGRYYELIDAQRFSIPLAGVQIQDASSFEGELGVPWKDPAAMVPGTDGILIEPAPDGLTADSGH